MKTDTILSRRRLLATMPAVAAVGVPVTAVAISAVPAIAALPPDDWRIKFVEHALKHLPVDEAKGQETLELLGRMLESHNTRMKADAELFKLGDEISELAEREAEMREELEPAWEEYTAAMRQRILNEHHGRITRDEMLSQDAESRQRLKLDEGLNVEHKQISATIEEKIKRVMELPAHTVKGLATHAIAAEYACSDLWEQTENELDWDRRIMRNLIEQVRVTGAMLWSG
jgi:hypothetical protein